MKNGISIFIFCISFLAMSQDVKRENIKGKIIVENNDIEGIAIYNSSSKTGALTNEKGEFTIELGLNDLLEIRAIQYQNFDITVNEAILESKKLSVVLIEEINMLDEVIINSKELTGDIKTDLTKVKTFTPKLDIVYFGMKDLDTYGFNNDNNSKIENTTLHSQAKPMIHGLNVVNVVDQLLIPLFRSEVKDKKKVGVPEIPAKAIKYYLASNFLIENFDIPEHRVEEFIRYVEDKAFNFDLLNYGHEMELLELISNKSKTFLTPENKL